MRKRIFCKQKLFTFLFVDKKEPDNKKTKAYEKEIFHHGQGKTSDVPKQLKQYQFLVQYHNLYHGILALGTYITKYSSFYPSFHCT